MTIETRPTVRCSGCELVQFETRSGDCRKCGAVLHPPSPPEPAAAPAPVTPKPAPPAATGCIAEWIGGRIALLRDWRNIPQRQLAQRMGVPRTYISKVENSKAVPTIGSLERIAAALRVPFSVLLIEQAEFTAWFLADGQRDPLMAELLSVLSRLSTDQRQMILNTAIDLAPAPGWAERKRAA